MALGPGKYDDLCTYVRKKAGITPDMNGGAIVIVIGGLHGDGFSVQAGLHTTLMLPRLLEQIAREMRTDLLGGRDG
jgi:hypothetical protein